MTTKHTFPTLDKNGHGMNNTSRKDLLSSLLGLGAEAVKSVTDTRELKSFILTSNTTVMPSDAVLLPHKVNPEKISELPPEEKEEIGLEGLTPREVAAVKKANIQHIDITKEYKDDVLLSVQTSSDEIKTHLMQVVAPPLIAVYCAVDELDKELAAIFDDNTKTSFKPAINIAEDAAVISLATKLSEMMQVGPDVLDKLTNAYISKKYTSTPSNSPQGSSGKSSIKSLVDGIVAGVNSGIE